MKTPENFMPQVHAPCAIERKRLRRWKGMCKHGLELWRWCVRQKELRRKKESERAKERKRSGKTKWDGSDRGPWISPRTSHGVRRSQVPKMLCPCSTTLTWVFIFFKFSEGTGDESSQFPSVRVLYYGWHSAYIHPDLGRTLVFLKKPNVSFAKTTSVSQIKQSKRLNTNVGQI